MRAMTAKAARNSRSKTSVSLCVGRGRRAGDRNAVPGDRDVILTAPLGAVRGIGPGEVAATLGSHRAAVQDQVGMAPQHADQHGVNLRQQLGLRPTRQEAAELACASVAFRPRHGVPSRRNRRKVAAT
jgi:hypothetical protein